MRTLGRMLLTIGWIATAIGVTNAASPERQQSAGVVEGRILDAGSGDPLAGARITAVDAPGETSSDRDGRFRLSLPPGDHKLLVTYLGRQDQVVDVKVTSRGLARLDVTMSVAAFEAQVTVTAPTLILESEER